MVWSLLDAGSDTQLGRWHKAAMKTAAISVVCPYTCLMEYKRLRMVRSEAKSGSRSAKRLPHDVCELVFEQAMAIEQVPVQPSVFIGQMTSPGFYQPWKTWVLPMGNPQSHVVGTKACREEYRCPRPKTVAPFAEAQDPSLEYFEWEWISRRAVAVGQTPNRTVLMYAFELGHPDLAETLSYVTLVQTPSTASNVPADVRHYGRPRRLRGDGNF